MEVSVLNCGTMRPRGARFLVPRMSASPCLCLLIEEADRLILVDSGLGTMDMEDPTGRLGFSNVLLNAERDPGLTALRQLRGRGLHPEQVTDIICTHLDRDHAGGLPDFPDARVHVLRPEHDHALDPPSRRERERYRRCHFAHGPRWEVHEGTSGEDWFGFNCIRNIEGLPSEVVLVPLPGHTLGHCGVAVRYGQGWLFHCGDSYYARAELAVGQKAPAGVRAFRSVAHLDRSCALRQLERIKGLLAAHGSEVATIASHDQAEYVKRFGRAP
ncbi:MAG: MBL fold metallo-hydrolase [Actinobacteria bacterium]|nr:MBL fold metallo-hydrolase [Actinomycetota bacterium]MBU1945121.1 MBL fold metallo-hydrolase [Actinomycetota bacterium]MBU2686428.1 MBL fold metallo-hydrolase [Actinomycetota bacterium]